MNIKTMMTTAAAVMLATAAQAITSEEIAAALDVDPSIGTFSCSGVSDWYVDTSVTNNGTSSMRSGAVPIATWGTFATSELTLTINVKEATRMFFWLKTSCYDYSSSIRLIVTIDQSTYTYTGIKDWWKVAHVLVPGTHSIKWSYSKRYDYVSGYDCVWVDNLSFTPIMAESPTVEVTKIACTQRTPWNGKVDIDYTVSCSKENADIWVYPVGYDKDSNKTMAPRALEGDGVNAPVKAGTHRMTWTVTDDYPGFNSTAFTVKMTALIGAAPYMVVDLSGGVDAISYPVTYLSSVPEGGWSDEYKTTKLVLRLIPPGSFWMGSPSDETGRGSYEDLHGVVLTKPFYLSVFECTQKQYQLVMGTTPSCYKGDMRPVEQVTYENIRGSVNGIAWPSHKQVDATSFMGRLRSKANMFFDLPTEAQWEYACRAGTSSALNSGKECGTSFEIVVGRMSADRTDGKGGYTQHTKVGCYLENAWGLYDMHGNVGEWCNDTFNNGLGTLGAIDPVGASWNGSKVIRGGSWYKGGWEFRSARRDWKMSTGNTSDQVGFRVYCSPVAQ